MSKVAPQQLAVFGNAPEFDRPLHVGAPNIGDPQALLARIQSTLDRRWLTNDGPLAQEFERTVAQMVGVDHCIATCNATLALEILARALDLTGEVLVPAFTFIATAHSLQWQKITPVFCDIDPMTFNVSPEDVVRKITPRTSGILAVHLWGRGCEINRLQEIADAFGIPLIFDASHAFGCTWGGRPIGSWGKAEVFSFHATKFVNALEGGAICTNDGELAQRCRRMKNFGIAGPDHVVCVGTNGKMNEWSAAMGLTSLESIDTIVETNRRHYEAYRRSLSTISGLRLLDFDQRERSNYQYVIVEVDASRTQLDRDTMVRLLHAEGVLARRYFTPGCHRMEPYRSRKLPIDGPLPHTDFAARTTMALPTGTALTKDDVERVVNLLALMVRHGQEIRRQLAVASPVKLRIA